MTTLTVNMSLPGAPADTTPPTLSALSASASGANGWTGSVSTDEGDGYLYWVVTGNATEDAATVKGGSFQAVSATGTLSLSGGGLQQSTTYRLHVLHRDAAGNDSAVLSSPEFTTSAQGAGTGTVSVATTRRMDSSTAPEAMFLRATVSDASVTASDPNAGYDESWNEIVYIWDFGDTQVSTNGVNLPQAFGDLSQGGGREVAHVFLTPGTYTVACDAYRLDGTFIGRGTLDVTVSASTAYAGNRTILVDSTGTGDSGTYPGSQVFTTFSAACTAARSLGGAVRILGKRGDTYTISSAETFSGGMTDVHLDAWGSGAMPKLRPSSFSGSEMVFFGSNFNGDARVCNWDIEGLHNPVNETGTPIDCVGTFQHNDRNVLVSRCRLHNGTRGVVFSDNPVVVSDFMGVAHDCDISAWLDYGVYCGRNSDSGGCTQFYAVIGGAIYQDPNANMGGNGKVGSNNRHGPIRVSVGHRVYIDAVDMFSRNSWPTGNDAPPGIQPCVRFNTNDNYDDGHVTSGVIRRCAMEASADMITNTSSGEAGAGTNGGGTARNLLVENIYAVSSSHANSFFFSEFGGATLRNCIYIVPNVVKPFGTNRTVFVSLEPAESPPYTGASWPLKVYNNTMIDYRSGAVYGGGTKNFAYDNSGSNITAFSTANNIHWCPNDTGQSDSSDPNLDLSTALTTIAGTFDTRFLGWKWDNVAMDTSKATPDSIATTLTPQAGSNVIGAATGTTAPFDIWGNQRDANPDEGAVERP